MYFSYVIMWLQNLHTVAVFKGVGMKMACVGALLYGMMKHDILKTQWWRCQEACKCDWLFYSQLWHMSKTNNEDIVLYKGETYKMQLTTL